MTDIARARAALAAAGFVDCEPRYLADGLSSEAWLFDSDGRRLVLRLAEHDTDEYEREHRILAALDARVPTPVIGSWQCPAWSETPFSVTTFVDGPVLDPGDVMAVADDIAAFLDVLHATEPPPGLPSTRERFAARLWPIDRADLSDHPVDAATAARLASIADVVRLAIGDGHVLVHSDLHEGNIIRSEHGPAFLDFGCAFVGSSLWDVAALAYFLGWPVAERVDAGPLRDVRLVALAFALYRWDVSRDDADECEHAARFIHTTLVGVDMSGP